jgi:hypothetical protein
MRLAAITSAVSEASVQLEQDPRASLLAQWVNGPNWGNYFNNWVKPWYTFGNWGNF